MRSSTDDHVRPLSPDKVAAGAVWASVEYDPYEVTLVPSPVRHSGSSPASSSGNVPVQV